MGCPRASIRSAMLLCLLPSFFPFGCAVPHSTWGLSPRPGVEPATSAVEADSQPLNRRDSPHQLYSQRPVSLSSQSLPSPLLFQPHGFLLSPALPFASAQAPPGPPLWPQPRPPSFLWPWRQNSRGGAAGWAGGPGVWGTRVQPRFNVLHQEWLSWAPSVDNNSSSRFCPGAQSRGTDT